MRLTDRPQLQYAALLVLAAGALFCAIGLRENGFMIAGFIGLAAVCVLIVIGAALTRHDRATWEPRLRSLRARRWMDVFSVAVIACFIIGFILNFVPFA